jgi:hypothetical protein
MGRHDLHQLMTALRASIARLTETRTEDRAMTRALAHLWSAVDELEMLSEERLVPRVS